MGTLKFLCQCVHAADGLVTEERMYCGEDVHGLKECLQNPLVLLTEMSLCLATDASNAAF